MYMYIVRVWVYVYNMYVYTCIYIIVSFVVCTSVGKVCAYTPTHDRHVLCVNKLEYMQNGLHDYNTSYGLRHGRFAI